MDKILLINLKKFGDLFQSGHLINSIRNLSPNTQIDILCFEESVKAAKTLNGVDNVHSINRKKIISFYKNNIYSDGLAFNQIIQNLEPVLAGQYDRVINYSNDLVSTYLTSYIANKLNAQIFGIKFDSKNSVTHSNPFAIVLNDVLTTSPFTPFNFNDSYHYLCGLEEHHSNQVKIKSNQTHDETAANNFDRLRATKTPENGNSYIVGIQIASASETKNIPETVLIETIELLLNSENIVPILLNAPSEDERNLIKRINSKLDNKLVSVEADFIALPSVLKGINLLLTPDTSVKHVADLVNTPCLEISLGEAPFLKQGTINPASAIISRPANLRVFKEGIEDKNLVITANKELRPELIFHTIQALLGSEENIEFNDDLNSNFCVYKPTNLSTGVIFSPVSGPYSEDYEIKRLLSRAVTLRLANTENAKDISFSEIYEHIYKRFDRRSVSRVINAEKKALSDLTRDLLSTLRGLIQTQEDKRKAGQFVEGLERLISHCFDNDLAALPTIFFRARIESLNATSLDENFKGVENLLYDLKSNLQHCFNVFKELENFEKTNNSQVSTTEARL